MPKVEIKETAREVDLLEVSSENGLVIEKEIEGYKPDYHYYIKYHKTEGNRILALIGLPYEVEYFETPNPNEVGFAKVNITEDDYSKIQSSILSKDYLTFYDEENDLVYSRRLSIELLDGVFDSSVMAFVNDDPDNKNIIRFKINALDSNDNPDDDMKDIYLKILRAGGDVAPVPNIIVKCEHESLTDPIIINQSDRKAVVPNGSVVTVDLNNEKEIDFMTIRAKAYVPNVSYWWLTLYLRFKRLD